MGRLVFPENSTSSWAIDRLGWSLIDLLETIRHLEAVGVDLYFNQQHLDSASSRSPRLSGSGVGTVHRLKQEISQR